MTEDILVGVTDAARLLDCSEGAVRHRELRGVIPAALRVSGRRAWRRADLVAYVAEREQADAKVGDE